MDCICRAATPAPIFHSNRWRRWWANDFPSCGLWQARQLAHSTLGTAIADCLINYLLRVVQARDKSEKILAEGELHLE
jgi:hypothetical protein